MQNDYQPEQIEIINCKIIKTEVFKVEICLYSLCY